MRKKIAFIGVLLLGIGVAIMLRPPEKSVSEPVIAQPVSVQSALPAVVQTPVVAVSPLNLKLDAPAPSYHVQPKQSLRVEQSKPAIIDVSLCGDGSVYRPDGLARRFSKQKAGRDGSQPLPVECGMIKTSIPFSF